MEPSFLKTIKMILEFAIAKLDLTSPQFFPPIATVGKVAETEWGFRFVAVPPPTG